MKYVKGAIGILGYYVIGIVKLPITLIVALGVAIEAGFMWLMKKTVEFADFPMLTESYNIIMDWNSIMAVELSDVYENMEIDEESEEEDLGES